MPTLMSDFKWYPLPTAFYDLFTWANVSVPVEQSKARLVLVWMFVQAIGVSSAFPNVDIHSKNY